MNIVCWFIKDFWASGAWELDLQKDWTNKNAADVMGPNSKI